MKNRTAVEWLIHQLITQNEVALKGENYKLFELAKEMEKEQMKNAVLEQCTKHERLKKIFEKQFEEYYNETFKSE